jgi:hypothetical protein
MPNSWEERIQALCDNTGAICAHSRQSPRGDRYNFDMTCQFVPSANRRLYSVADGQSNATLHCINCDHFTKEQTNQ